MRSMRRHGQASLLATGRYGFPPTWQITLAEIKQLIDIAENNVRELEESPHKLKCDAFLINMQKFAKQRSFVVTSKQLSFLCDIAKVDPHLYIYLNVPWHESAVPQLDFDVTEEMLKAVGVR